MTIFIGFLYVIEVLSCLLLALVIQLQKPKEGGRGGAIGGGMLEASLGADAGNVLIKATAILGAIFLANPLVLARLTSTVHARSIMAREVAPAAQTATAKLGAARCLAESGDPAKALERIESLKKECEGDEVSKSRVEAAENAIKRFAKEPKE